MTGLRVCPHCGGSMFAAKIIVPGAVQSMEDGTFKVISESKDKVDISIAMCARCRRGVTEEDLVAGITCKECGRVVNSNDIDDNGVCDVCKAKKERSDIANASYEDLVKKVLELEKAAKGFSLVTAPVTDDPSKESNEHEKTVETSVVSDSKDTQSSEKKARPKKRAKSEELENKPEAEENADETQPVHGSYDEKAGDTTANAESNVEENIDALANAQEAPFPDIAPMGEDTSGIVNTPESDISDADVTGVNNFAMFESSCDELY